MNKQKKRYIVLAALENMDKELHAAHSIAIKNQLINAQEFKLAETIGITISRFPEILTFPIIEAAWSAGKRVAIPKCHPEMKGMDFRTFTSCEQLEKTFSNLQEPIVSKTVSVSKEEIGLQIVPGIVFSPNGNRVGFGGGYYDRYLVDFEGDVVSLALELQIEDEIQAEKHDVPVNKIFTEKRIIHCKKDPMLS